MDELCLNAVSSGKSNYMSYFSHNKFTSRGGHSHILFIFWGEKNKKTKEFDSTEIISDQYQLSNRSKEVEKSMSRWRGGECGLTELKAVDAQTGVCGVVEPPLLPPAAGGVCVHLPCCNTCRVRHTQARQFQLWAKEDCKNTSGVFVTIQRGRRFNGKVV